MNTITESKSPALNRLEGFTLTALFQGFPTFAGSALLLKLVGSHEIVGTRYGAAIFVVLATLLFALLTPWLGRKFPNRFQHGYEPRFFDPSLSFIEKIARWRTQPVTSLQLVTNVMLLSLLAVGVASVG